jgi:hypothetical protein
VQISAQFNRIRDDIWQPPGKWRQTIAFLRAGSTSPTRALHFLGRGIGLLRSFARMQAAEFLDKIAPLAEFLFVRDALLEQ